MIKQSLLQEVLTESKRESIENNYDYHKSWISLPDNKLTLFSLTSYCYIILYWSHYWSLLVFIHEVTIPKVFTYKTTESDERTLVSTLTTLSLAQDNKCIVLNWPMTTTIVVLRSMTDYIYLMHILLQVHILASCYRLSAVCYSNLWQWKLILHYINGENMYFVLLFFHGWSIW